MRNYTNLPVLIITFNRPEHVRHVLKAVSAVSPTELFIFQDGPRNDSDKVLCAEVRSVLDEMVSWPCNKRTYYSENNLGCGPGPAAAITWFFNHVESGIILEDDCIPSRDFFFYCEELLSRYENDERIGFIGGCNYGYKSTDDATYSFCSGHHETWGWATWRRTWKIFDYNLDGIDKTAFRHVVKNYFKTFKQREYWMNIFLNVKKDRFNDSCWDYQFYFSMWMNGMLAICPDYNLVSNTGFGDDATHTHDRDSKLLSRSTESMPPIVHPTHVEYDYSFDDFLMREYIIPYEYGISGLRRIPFRINRFIKHTVGHQGPWFKKQQR
jgi:hypothetical protein